MFRHSAPTYPHNSFQHPIQLLPSSDDILPSTPDDNDALPRVSPLEPQRVSDPIHDTTIPSSTDESLSRRLNEAPTTDQLQRVPTMPDRSMSLSRISTTSSSAQPASLLVQKKKVSFIPTDISMIHILPPITSDNDSTHLEFLSDVAEHAELAALITTDPLLRRLYPRDSPQPTTPLPFVITKETDITPVLQRHKPASAQEFGLSVNTKTNMSIPKTEYTVRAKNVIKPKYSRDVNGPRRDKILKAHHDEYVRLIDTTKTMTFTNTKPSAAIATYYNPILESKTDQDGNHIDRVRGTGGGNKVVYEFGNTSHVADTMAFKILMNALASEDAHLITSDLKDFFLTAKLPEKVYLKILWSQIPQQTIDMYNLQLNTDSKGVKFIYGELHQALYGLPQANSLAAQELKQNLATHEFYETDIPCLYRHKTRNIVILVHVDDFAIKLDKKPTSIIADALFIKQFIHECKYTGKFNWGGIDFINNIIPNTYNLTWCGYEIAHDKIKRTVTISMDDYYAKIAAQFPSDLKASMTLGIPFNIKYGAKEQFIIEPSPEFKLTPEQLKFLQKFVGEI